jgi:hypothetical protein
METQTETTAKVEKLNGKSRKLSREDFIVQGILNLRKEPYKGIHVVYSGFNKAFMDYFGESSKEYIDVLVEEGLLVKFLARGGVIIGLAVDFPKKERRKKTGRPPHSDTLKKILGK